MREISIRLLLVDLYNNKKLLDVTNDKFGVLKYSLYGELTGLPYSLDNLQVKRRLPDAIDDLFSLNDLTEEIIKVVNTGTKTVMELVYQKEIVEKGKCIVIHKGISGGEKTELDNRTQVKRCLAYYFNLIAKEAGVPLDVDNIIEIEDMIETIYNDLGGKNETYKR